MKLVEQEETNLSLLQVIRVVQMMQDKTAIADSYLSLSKKEYRTLFLEEELKKHDGTH